MDIGFEGGDYNLESMEGRRIKIQAGNKGSLIIFMKDIIQSQEEKRNELTITQRFYDPKDRHMYLEDEPFVEIEKEVNEFIY